MREGSLEAPTRHALDWQNPWFWDEKALEKEMERVFDICHGCRRCFNLCDSFPRLFDLIDNGPTGEARRREEGGLRPGRGGLHALRHVLHDQVPLRAAARVGARFPASDAAPPRGAGAQEGHRPRRPPARRDRPQRPARHLRRRPRQLGDRRAQHARRARSWSGWPASITARACRAMPARPSRSAPRARAPALNEAAPAFGKRKAVLYATCFVNFNNTDIGAAARAVLAQNGVETEVVYPACCGMPQARAGRSRRRGRRGAAGVGGAAALGRQGLRRDRAHAVLRPDAEVRMAADPAQGSRGRAPVAGDLRHLRIRRRHRQEGRAGARPASRSRAASASISPATPAPRTWAPRRPRCCGWCPRRGSR